MTDGPTFPRRPVVWITVVQEDPFLDGMQIMQSRKVVLGDICDEQVRREAALYYEQIIHELVDERSFVLADGTLMSENKREYSRDEPVALDDRDPGNSEPEDLTAPLEHDDNVYTLVRPDQGDLREVSPAAEWCDDPRHGS